MTEDCAATRYRKRWLLKVPETFKDEFQLSDNNWEVISSGDTRIDGTWLRVFPAPENTVNNAYQGGANPALEFTGAGVTYKVVALKRGFKLDIIDERASLFKAVRRLTNLSSGSSYTQLRLVTVLDFLYPEDPATGDVVTIGQEEATLRYGRIAPTPKGGFFGVAGGEQFVRGGFSIEFEESKLRLTV